MCYVASVSRAEPLNLTYWIVHPQLLLGVYCPPDTGYQPVSWHLVRAYVTVTSRNVYFNSQFALKLEVLTSFRLRFGSLTP